MREVSKAGLGKELQFILLLFSLCSPASPVLLPIGWEETETGILQWRIQGRARPPLIFRPKWGPKGRKKDFWDNLPSPLSKGLDDRSPSPLLQGLDPALSFPQCFAPLHSLPSGVSCTSPAWLNETGKTATRITLLFRELKQQRRRRRQLRTRDLKSEFALPQTLSRLFHLV